MSCLKRGVVPLVFLTLFASGDAFACACGCGVFDVNTAAVLPTGEGGTLWLEHNYAEQDENWRGTSSSTGHNHDKKIRTNFYTLGGQYMLNRSWGFKVAVPFVDRMVKKQDHAHVTLTPEHRGLGDIRVAGIYSGFSPDMSAGVTVGLKLPTGDTGQTDFDRETALGTGSTNVQLGAYRMGRFERKNYGWFASALWDQPVLTRDHYRPGSEVNASIGAYREGWSVGGIAVTPMVHIIGTHRRHDSGANAHDPEATGYTRFVAAPGVELNFGKGVKLYGDVGVPVYQNTRGNQVTAPLLFKTVLSYGF